MIQFSVVHTTPQSHVSVPPLPFRTVKHYKGLVAFTRRIYKRCQFQILNMFGLFLVMTVGSTRARARARVCVCVCVCVCVSVCVCSVYLVSDMGISIDNTDYNYIQPQTTILFVRTWSHDCRSDRFVYLSTSLHVQSLALQIITGTTVYRCLLPVRPLQSGLS